MNFKKFIRGGSKPQKLSTFILLASLSAFWFAVVMQVELLGQVATICFCIGLIVGVKAFSGIARAALVVLLLVILTELVAVPVLGKYRNKSYFSEQ